MCLLLCPAQRLLSLLCLWSVTQRENKTGFPELSGVSPSIISRFCRSQCKRSIGFSPCFLFKSNWCLEYYSFVTLHFFVLVFVYVCARARKYLQHEGESSVSQISQFVGRFEMGAISVHCIVMSSFM